MKTGSPCRRCPALVILALACSVLASSAGAATRRDVVVMKNGDRLTGEIKKLERGQLFVETDYAADVLKLDWLQVAWLESKASFRVEVTSGKRYAGTIEKLPQQSDVIVRNDQATVRVPEPEIVDIQPLKPGFWKQVKGSIDAGFSFTSGNEQTQMNVNASAAYLSTGYKADVALHSTFSGQAGAANTNRQNVTTSYTKYLPRRNWNLLGLADFLKSNQQDLILRTTLAGGVGRYLIRSNTSVLGVVGGAAFNNEHYNPSSGANPRQQNVEGLIGLAYQVFRFKGSEFQANLKTYPGMSDPGRFRLNFDTNFKIKFTQDLYLQFSFYDTYDSKPPVVTRKNELGISTTFGWSF